MILTEEEAKNRRCQEGFNGPPSTSPTVPVDGGTIWSRALSSPVYCMGSACMAWRWKRGNLYTPIPEFQRFPPNHPNYADFEVTEDAGEYSTTHGYCGKAGKP